MIKRYLISKGKLLNTKELVFIPTGGVRGMGPVTKLVTSRDNKLPYVLLDSDKVGKEYLKQLTSGAYKENQDRVIEVACFLGVKEYEIEDLIPAQKLVEVVDRTYRGSSYFDEFYKKDEPIVDQIEDWARKNNITLEKSGWKVELARLVINQFDRTMKDVPVELETAWSILFQKLIS